MDLNFISCLQYQEEEEEEEEDDDEEDEEEEEPSIHRGGGSCAALPTCNMATMAPTNLIRKACPGTLLHMKAMDTWREAE